MKNIILLTIMSGVFLFLSYQTTRALFTDAASITGNTFTAASEFPSPTTEEEEPPSEPTGGEVTPIEQTNPGDVLINEINWAGNNDNTKDEWIELKNTTNRDISLDGWKIIGLGSSNSAITIPSGKTISANGFFLISHYDKDNSKININSELVSTSVNLHNDGEILTLKAADDTTIDTANHTGTWFAGVNSPEPKKSMERVSPPGDGTMASQWVSAATHTNMDGNTEGDEFGTPGAENGM